ncbi:ATP-binding cassette domain-containing protein [Azospirillum sp. RWY-5-1]|uniref:ATP-binding cassette domain-containing protein n=1 Tax=Azospirillum oleiclasticum TaxID=2735135 RepID=A0ABX2T6G5_9PROT|nr:ATP-binding cassette domain-containing protein [Azospirillum oleiclasticum]NYZ11716.1 ATP-binding cassette domain-containing protein [Azospirillum oleiclasticum]NYZ18877.1 ATP-binding cassette domain-containing protein [Azospirillum oleiclasticum]
MNGSLRIDGVSLAVAGQPVIGPLTLEVAPGAVVTLMGPSGCGKSSLLAFISGCLDPAFTARGRVLLDGRDLEGLPPERRRVGTLFQDDLLFPHLSVGGNLAFGLPASVRGRRTRAERVEAALADAGLAGFAARDPATLSGGQRARVALMRTLLAEPGALLLDEPFGKLDAALRDQMRAFVFARARAAGVPTLLVTHDAGDAEAAGGPVIVLESTREV